MFGNFVPIIFVEKTPLRFVSDSLILYNLLLVQLQVIVEFVLLVPMQVECV